MSREKYGQVGAEKKKKFELNNVFIDRAALTGCRPRTPERLVCQQMSSPLCAIFFTLTNRNRKLGSAKRPSGDLWTFIAVILSRLAVWKKIPAFRL
ncbi:hypothetical protein RRG08_057750 [Elysia crispata]|uniref:Uncharacterized protein n=1 Tax=Elysia crispata TaxID=231223 RepID=A0AAE0YHY5_9GAST|nr:hypothetical protein RRG08_057750 [Elysia crispata]